MEYGNATMQRIGASSILGANRAPPMPPQPISARLAQSLTLAESLVEQVTRIADSVTGPQPCVLDDSAKTQTFDTNLARQADALSITLTRLGNQVDRLNSSL